MLKEEFANRIKQLRQEKRWSQETAAEICDLSSRYGGKLERAEASASIDTIEKISKGFQVSAAELMKEEDGWM